MTSYFKNEGDLIYLLGEDFEEIGGSEYLKVIHGVVAGEIPKIDLPKEKQLHEIVLELISKKLINSAHDVSDGGIITALAECCVMKESKQFGAEISIQILTREDLSLFSESQSRVIVSVPAEKKEEFDALLFGKFFPVARIGKVGGNSFLLNGHKINLLLLSNIYFNTISKLMDSQLS